MMQSLMCNALMNIMIIMDTLQLCFQKASVLIYVSWSKFTQIKGNYLKLLIKKSYGLFIILFENSKLKRTQTHLNFTHKFFIKIT